MHSVLSVVFFIYGIIFGSFYNVVGLRVPTRSLFKENRSYCDNCQRTLAWTELIPIWSYILQRGKCKRCCQKISILYPIIEATTGFLFVYSYYQFAWSSSLILAILLISLIIPITVSDLIYQKIPNRILLFFTPLFIIFRLIYPLRSFENSLIGALFAFILIFLIIYLSNGGMGMGDLKYYTLFGFIFGLPNFLLLFFLSALYGVIAGIVMMATEKQVGRKTKIAFGPYIGLAALTVLYFGEAMIEWYIQLII